MSASPKSILAKQRSSIAARLSTGKGRWALAAVGVLIVLGGSYWAFRDATGGVRHVTEPARRGNLTVVVTATGFVQPLNKVDV